MVQGGGCSAKDLRDVFKNNIDKRVKNLPEIDGLSKETVSPVNSVFVARVHCSKTSFPGSKNFWFNTSKSAVSLHLQETEVSHSSAWLLCL